MSELYVATHDALMRAVVPVYTPAKMPDYPRPRYLPEIPPQTVREYRAALGKLGQLGLVKVN